MASIFGRDFVRAYNPAFQQGMANEADRQRAIQQDMLLRQRMEEEKQRRLLEQLAPYRVAPVTNQDGSINESASLAALKDAQDADAMKKDMDRKKAEYEFNLGARGRAVGVDPSKPQFMTGHSLSPGTIGKTIAPEQAIIEAENAQKLAFAGRESEARAAAGAPFRERYTSRGPYEVGGRFVGDAVRDNVSGQIGIMQDGKLVPLPDNATPITATGLQKSIPDMKTFRQLKSDVTDAEISLQGLNRYLASQGDTNTGIARFVDGFVADMKTISGLGLSPEELALKMSKGQLQGLLGANRTNVVGGGVMTEQDALRIIERLGGNVNALQNPEVVRAAIEQLYSDRYKQYMDDVRFYNAATDDYYGSKGFERVKPMEFNALLRNDYAPGPGDGSATQQAANASKFKVVEIR